MNSKKNNYTWMLKDKETGKIYPKFTYKNRVSARKATKSKRLSGYFPVKVFTTKVDKNTRSVSNSLKAAPKPVNKKVTTKSVRHTPRNVSEMERWYGQPQGHYQAPVTARTESVKPVVRKLRKAIKPKQIFQGWM